MTPTQFQAGVRQLFAKHEAFIRRPNQRSREGNGVFERYQHPVLTAAHTPIFWRYDLNPEKPRT